MRGTHAESRALRVLLVDDSDDDRVRFGRALSRAGYEVHAAEGGSQAYAVRSRRCARTSRPAFVIVTSRPSQDEETRASMLGAIGYLAKPIAVRELSQVLVSSRA